jgi:hypothetical protein
MLLGWGWWYLSASLLQGIAPPSSRTLISSSPCNVRSPCAGRRYRCILGHPGRFTMTVARSRPSAQPPRVSTTPSAPSYPPDLPRRSFAVAQLLERFAKMRGLGLLSALLAVLAACGRIPGVPFSDISPLMRRQSLCVCPHGARCRSTPSVCADPLNQLPLHPAHTSHEAEP